MNVRVRLIAVTLPEKTPVVAAISRCDLGTRVSDVQTSRDRLRRRNYLNSEGCGGQLFACWLAVGVGVMADVALAYRTSSAILFGGQGR